MSEQTPVIKTESLDLAPHLSCCNTLVCVLEKV